jgi:hypothetical protein
MPVSFNGSGQVVSQVISTIKTDTFTTSSTITASGGALVNTGAAVTGLSATITPRSSANRVLVRVSMYGCGQSTVGQMLVLLYRGSTIVGNAVTVGSRPGVNARASYMDVAEYNSSTCIEFLDSPSTTSATTYSVNVGGDAGTAYVNRTESDANSGTNARTASTITLMEISG